MNICISFLTFSENVFGGIEKSIYNLAEGFILQGHKVLIYTSRITGIESNIGQIEIFRSDLLPSSLSKDEAYMDNYVEYHLLQNKERIGQEISFLIKEKAINLLISVDALWGITMITDSWKHVRCSHVVYLHVLNNIRHLSKIRDLGLPNVFCVSHDLKKKIEETVFINNMKVMPNSINTDIFSPSNSQLRSNKFFCNSRIAAGKGIETLIEAFSIFCATNNGFKLVLCAGNSPFINNVDTVNRVRKMIDKYSLHENVTFLPNIMWNEIPSHIRSSFAIILPTFYETFGIAAVEALACGTPLIASKVENLSTIIGCNALWVKPNSAGEISDALFRLIDDKELYDSLRINGVEVAKKFDNKLVSQFFLNSVV